MADADLARNFGGAGIFGGHLQTETARPHTAKTLEEEAVMQAHGLWRYVENDAALRPAGRAGYSDCLELVARQFGLADWNKLAARNSAASPADGKLVTPDGQ